MRTNTPTPNLIRVPRHGKRTLCLGGCGTWVLMGRGECHRCRKVRIRKGMRHIKRVAPLSERKPRKHNPQPQEAA